MRTEIGKHTKAQAQPIWAEATRSQVTTRLQTRLADSARTGVTTRNVFFRAGGVGKIGKTPLSQLARAIEHGAHPDTKVATRSRNGKEYTRRMGGGFRLPRSRGYVAYPASSEAIPRVASLWVQTAVRTIHEKLEKVK
ncbi:hypothetical protein [Leucobacter chironomi]|uniref:hypothetical protein n=1 Tax=Leucobacter chironomi TaxID=491918 RepID=UPI0012686EAF|nr:hypothetical protein [Leucobacter chironomi]